MSNIQDYLKWRGDISFKESPFNQVDNLILSELVYTDFEGIVPGIDEKKTITLAEASSLFFCKHTKEEILAKTSSTKMAAFLMEEMATTKRFSTMKLSGYVNKIDPENQSQFSVVTCILDDGTFYIAYRGTDNTVIGWKEDFNMGFLHKTQGQLQAVEYLNKVGASTLKKLRVGGHSKGGNFAVFASAFCKPKIKKKILQVYNNDGPGFQEAIIQTQEYQEILPKIKSYIPEQSIVGMLLMNNLEHQIVKSTNVGASQHDPLSWEVLGTSFVLCDQLADSSIWLDKTLKEWIFDLEPEMREEFVDILFSSIEDLGFQTLDELIANKKQVLAHINQYITYLPPEKQKVLREIMGRLGASVGASLLENMRQRLKVEKK